MITKTSSPLFEGSSTSMLSTMLLLNLKIIHGVNNILMDALFSLLKIKLLPKRTRCQPKLMKPLKLIKQLGLNYDSIHNYIDGCVFFQGTLKDCRVCPKCNTNKYVEKS
jgi:hypothetical protein